MRKKPILLTLILLLSFNFSKGQSISTLKEAINKILVDKDATVGIAISGVNLNDSLSINGDKKLPLQSVFKYHLALAVLNQVDKGKFNLNDKITITKEDLNNNLWSPIREEYPEGIDLALADILKYTVASSDNVGCDLLFKLVGGAKVVEKYLHEVGISDVAIEYNEATQQSKWELQYMNWTTAKSANQALRLFFENSKQQLSLESHTFLWKTMKSSWTGKNSIRGHLPKETVVAHKTGHSGKNDTGLTGAQNDIGIIFLPNGKHFYLSVLVSDSKEDSNVNEKIIADIAKLAWDYFENK
ncbi:class A beta-lactamase, subclass A2 [Nonlabens sp. Ci31]|uniref:class A beta-lactamase, subclass A2 n=1 Tax=Nonlabens sp. Ci31 TaxID=2608253 RepID=UPI001462DF86|nr:class A beta-lactamase, subclass A2 [Nonlabens sp. Ci31]QJP35393.1 class A beta-lactamase, subclass A2 [Nonlabens sp. Ci31]